MPARFSVLLTPSFRRDFERLPGDIQPRVLRAVALLENNPFGPAGRVKKLKAKGVGQWRLEVWPYRVRYDIAGHDVVLYHVRHRSEICRD